MRCTHEGCPYLGPTNELDAHMATCLFSLRYRVPVDWNPTCKYLIH